MSISVEIVQGGRVLRQYNHGGRLYVEAPPEGDYAIRLTNRSWGRRLCVLSVDGLNAIDGTDAGFDGPGYVLASWQTVNIKGWRRSDSEVASFRFNPVGEGYAEKTGRGAKNTGRIGVAVFEEKPSWSLSFTTQTYPCSHTMGGSEVFGSSTRGMVTPQMDSFNAGGGMRSANSGTQCSTTSSGPVAQPTSRRTRDAQGRFTKELKRKSVSKTKGAVVASACAAPDISTGYGQRATMHTSSTEFERATESPCAVIELMYAVREKLVEWGVPVSRAPECGSAFPASTGPTCPAPSDWNG